MRFFQKKCDEYKKEARQIMEYLRCECEVLSKNMFVQEAEEEYCRALQSGKSEGYTPVLIIPSASLYEQILLNQNSGETRNTKLQETKKRLQMRENEAAGECVVSKFHEIKSLFTLIEEKNQLSQDIVLAKIPCRHPWEVFESLPVGVWNSATEPKEFTATAKDWYETYGAIPALVSSDRIDFFLEAPVQDLKVNIRNELSKLDRSDNL